MPEKQINFTKRTIDALPIPHDKSKRGYYYDTKARGLCISITNTAIKSFLVYRWIDGKPERITLGRYPELTIEQARGMASEINAAVARGENPAGTRRKAKNEITFAELFAEYIERYAKAHKRSWDEDKAQYERHLSHWRDKKLSYIKKSDIQNLHHSTGKEKGHYAANRLLALLSTVFNKAVEFGLWDKPNPAKGIKRFKEYTRDRFLQSDELPRFFKALGEEHNDSIRDYVLLSLLTGARRSNVVAMRWDQINLERAEWRIPQTKNGTPQTITLSSEALAVLNNRKSLMKDSEYVFPSTSKNGHLIEPKKGWRRILQRANLSNLRLHDLRRTLGSWQAKTGASLVIIGKSLNHKSPQATAIYARLDLDPVRESVEKATSAMLVAAGFKQTHTDPNKTIEKRKTS